MATNNAVDVTLSSQTGTGSFVGSISPTLVTPVIQGSNGFNIVTFADVASSTDYFTFTSGVANGAKINLVSSNTNGSFAIYAKGTGGVVVGTAPGGTSTNPLSMGNGTYSYAFRILSQSANRIIDFPDADVTLPANPMITRVNVQRVTATGAGTYTPTTGMKYVIVCAQAAGGGGGGSAATTTGQASAGGGGTGGEYIEALFTATDIGASKPYSVGAKGTGGSAGANAGNNGGNTTFNTTWIVTNGGVGGDAIAATSGQGNFGGPKAGGSGGTVATGTLIKRCSGGSTQPAFSIASNQGNAGIGGSSGSGSGGGNMSTGNAAGSAAAANTGAGGGGASSSNTAGAARAGGDGADGFITFIEFISA